MDTSTPAAVGHPSPAVGRAEVLRAAAAGPTMHSWSAAAFPGGIEPESSGMRTEVTGVRVLWLYSIMTRTGIHRAARRIVALGGRMRGAASAACACRSRLR